MTTEARPAMSSTRRRFILVAAAALALAAPLAVKTADAATTRTDAKADPPGTPAAISDPNDPKSTNAAAKAGADASFTPAQVLAGIQKNMTTENKVNSKPHINTQTRAKNVNVFQVASGVFAY